MKDLGVIRSGSVLAQPRKLRLKNQRDRKRIQLLWLKYQNQVEMQSQLNEALNQLPNRRRIWYNRLIPRSRRRRKIWSIWLTWSKPSKPATMLSRCLGCNRTLMDRKSLNSRKRAKKLSRRPQSKEARQQLALLRRVQLQTRIKENLRRVACSTNQVIKGRKISTGEDMPTWR